jgi:hypothetical protein
MITSGFCDYGAGFLDSLSETDIEAIACVAIGQLVQRLKQVRRCGDHAGVGFILGHGNPANVFCGLQVCNMTAEFLAVAWSYVNAGCF